MGAVAVFHARSRRPVAGSPLAVELDKAKESIAWNKEKLEEAVRAAEAAEAAVAVDPYSPPPRQPPEPPEPLEEGISGSSQEFELPPRRLTDVILDASVRQILEEGPDTYRVLEGLMRGLAATRDGPDVPAVRVYEPPKQLDPMITERKTP
jgi:hypothetical protein